MSIIIPISIIFHPTQNATNSEVVGRQTQPLAGTTPVCRIPNGRRVVMEKAACVVKNLSESC